MEDKMKKEEIIEKIKKHQLWLENKPGERADLSNTDMSGMDLSHIDLSFATLIYTDFQILIYLFLN